MKTLVKLLKPLLLRLLVWVFDKYQDKIINFMCKKKVSGKIPLSGEQYEYIVTENYKVFKSAIINLIEMEL